MNQSTQNLKELEIGDFVQIQNLLGNSKLRWDRSGQIVECLGHDQYKVKVDGAGRVTLRNRQHLRVIKPFTPSQDLIAEWPSNLHNPLSQAVTEKVDQARAERPVAVQLPGHADPPINPPLPIVVSNGTIPEVIAQDPVSISVPIVDQPITPRRGERLRKQTTFYGI